MISRRLLQSAALPVVIPIPGTRDVTTESMAVTVTGNLSITGPVQQPFGLLTNPRHPIVPPTHTPLPAAAPTPTAKPSTFAAEDRLTSAEAYTAFFLQYPQLTVTSLETFASRFRDHPDVFFDENGKPYLRFTVRADERDINNPLSHMVVFYTVDPQSPKKLTHHILYNQKESHVPHVPGDVVDTLSNIYQKWLKSRGSGHQKPIFNSEIRKKSQGAATLTRDTLTLSITGWNIQVNLNRPTNRTTTTLRLSAAAPTPPPPVLPTTDVVSAENLQNAKLNLVRLGDSSQWKKWRVYYNKEKNIGIAVQYATQALHQKENIGIAVQDATQSLHGKKHKGPRNIVAVYTFKKDKPNTTIKDLSQLLSWVRNVFPLYSGTTIIMERTELTPDIEFGRNQSQGAQLKITQNDSGLAINYLPLVFDNSRVVFSHILDAIQGERLTSYHVAHAKISTKPDDTISTKPDDTISTKNKIISCSFLGPDGQEYSFEINNRISSTTTASLKQQDRETPAELRGMEAPSGETEVLLVRAKDNKGNLLVACITYDIQDGKSVSLRNDAPVFIGQLPKIAPTPPAAVKIFEPINFEDHPQFNVIGDNASQYSSDPYFRLLGTLQPNTSGKAEVIKSGFKLSQDAPVKLTEPDQDLHSAVVSFHQPNQSGAIKFRLPGAPQTPTNSDPTKIGLGEISFDFQIIVQADGQRVVAVKRHPFHLNSAEIVVEGTEALLEVELYPGKKLDLTLENLERHGSEEQPLWVCPEKETQRLQDWLAFLGYNLPRLEGYPYIALRPINPKSDKSNPITRGPYTLTMGDYELFFVGKNGDTLTEFFWQLPGAAYQHLRSAFAPEPLATPSSSQHAEPAAPTTAPQDSTPAVSFDPGDTFLPDENTLQAIAGFARRERPCPESLVFQNAAGFTLTIPVQENPTGSPYAFSPQPNHPVRLQRGDKTFPVFFELKGRNWHFFSLSSHNGETYTPWRFEVVAHNSLFFGFFNVLNAVNLNLDRDDARKAALANQDRFRENAKNQLTAQVTRTEAQDITLGIRPLTKIERGNDTVITFIFSHPDGSALTLEGLSLNATHQTLQLSKQLTLTSTDTDSQPITLNHQRRDENSLLLTQIGGGENPRRFVLDLKNNTLREIVRNHRASFEVINAALARVLDTPARTISPAVISDMASESGGPRPSALDVRFPEGARPQDITTVLGRSDSTNPPILTDANQIRTLLNSPGASWSNEGTLPTYETLLKQAFLAPAEGTIEYMEFVFGNGHILGLPFIYKNRQWQLTDIKNPVFGTTGYVILQDNAGKKWRVHPKIFANGASLSIQFDEETQFTGSLIKTDSHKKVFGLFFSAGNSSPSSHEKKETRNNLKAFLALAHLDRSSAFMTRDDANPSGPHQIQLVRPEDAATILNTSLTLTTEDSTLVLNGFEKNEAGQLIVTVTTQEGPEQWSVYSLNADTDSPFLFFQNLQGQFYSVIIHANGIHLWPVSQNINDALNIAKGEPFFMTPIQGGGFYANTTASYLRAENRSEGNGVKVTAALGRSSGSGSLDTQGGQGQRQQNIEFEISTNEEGQLVVINSTADFEFSIQEDQWQDTDGTTHFGKVRISFKGQKTQDAEPYGWITFKNREHLMTSATQSHRYDLPGIAALMAELKALPKTPEGNLRYHHILAELDKLGVTVAHYHETDQYPGQKINARDGNFLLLGAGVLADSERDLFNLDHLRAFVSDDGPDGILTALESVNNQPTTQNIMSVIGLLVSVGFLRPSPDNDIYFTDAFIANLLRVAQSTQTKESGTPSST